MHFLRFLRDATREVFSGGKLYWAWMITLGVVALCGFAAYTRQMHSGLVVTGMSDHVSWGLYIANFTFLVGVAAAAVMLVIPAYIFHDEEAKHVVLIGEGLAVAACVACIGFVTVDLGRPERIWHLLPIVGTMNWPQSMLAWDILVLSGYLLINLSIPLYFLYATYRGRKVPLGPMLPVILLSIVWAISIHTVTAFLFSSNVARPFWHTALLGPRFLASAFTAGPAFMILAFRVIDRFTEFKVNRKTFSLLAIVAAVALQINLFMLGAEFFTEFYSPTVHAASATYLFFGLNGYDALVPWAYTAVGIELVAVVILMVHRLRENPLTLGLACVLAIVGVWIDKGMGLIIPGFVPTPLGDVLEYTPTLTEVVVCFGVWAVGLIVFTVLAKAAIPIETGRVHDRT